MAVPAFPLSRLRFLPAQSPGHFQLPGTMYARSSNRLEIVFDFDSNPDNSRATSEQSAITLGWVVYNIGIEVVSHTIVLSTS